MAAFDSGAGVYLCIVAKTSRGVESAHGRLAEVARGHAAPVLIVNCVGASVDGECAGGSSAWSPRGELLGRLDADHEGQLVFDPVREQSAVYTP